jgi:hypothetical protein
MAFVALAAAALTWEGKSGRRYQTPITKATAVGLCTFVQDGTTTWFAPEEIRLIDGFIGDTINAGDYLDFYVNNTVRPQLRVMEKILTSVTAINKIVSQWISSGAAVSVYHYSA